MTSVLIIDDDNDLAESTADYLRICGFDVVGIGHNGLDAVNLFQKHKPDCTILDYQMPCYDGLYGLKEIRKISSFGIVMILSGAIDFEIRRILIDNGATRVLCKPISVDDLCAVIQKELLVFDHKEVKIL